MNMRLLVIAATALTLGACASGPQPYSRGPSYAPPASYSQPVRCYDCGVVERIDRVYGARRNTGTGAVLGGLVGAVLGREVAGDHTNSRNKTRGTVAGAVVGAVAGHAVERKVNEETWDIHVRLDDGRRVVLNRNLLVDGVRVGAYVRLDGNRIIPMR